MKAPRPAFPKAIRLRKISARKVTKVQIKKAIDAFDVLEIRVVHDNGLHACVWHRSMCLKVLARRARGAPTHNHAAICTDKP